MRLSPSLGFLVRIVSQHCSVTIVVPVLIIFLQLDRHGLHNTSTLMRVGVRCAKAAVRPLLNDVWSFHGRAWKVVVVLLPSVHASESDAVGRISCTRVVVVGPLIAAHNFRNKVGHGEFDVEFNDVRDGSKLDVAKITKIIS